MSTTLAQARDIVAAAEAPTWNFGTYYVAPDGYDAGTHWLIESGPRELLVDMDPAFIEFDARVPLVSKADGAISYVDARDDIVRAAKPVGQAAAIGA